jgi:hypothetical protein
MHRPHGWHRRGRCLHGWHRRVRCLPLRARDGGVAAGGTHAPRGSGMTRIKFAEVELQLSARGHWHWWHWHGRLVSAASNSSLCTPRAGTSTRSAVLWIGIEPDGSGRAGLSVFEPSILKVQWLLSSAPPSMPGRRRLRLRRSPLKARCKGPCRRISSVEGDSEANGTCLGSSASRSKFRVRPGLPDHAAARGLVDNCSAPSGGPCPPCCSPSRGQ